MKYFRDNKIYSKEEFETQFRHRITKARDYDYIFSEKDLWAGIKPDYNRASTDYKIGGKYKYSLSDLITREKYFRDENVFKTAIEKFENDGNAQPISVKDGYDQDLARYGSDSALFGFTKYASSVAEAPMKAYMAYRFGPEILKQYLKSVSEDATSKFLKGASIEFASQYIAEEAFGIEMKIPELILDMVSSGLKEVYTPEKLYAEMAVDCIIGIDIFDLLSKIENDQNIDFLDLGIQCVIPAVSGPVFKIASNKAGKFFNMKSFKLIRVLNFIEKFGIKDKGKYIFELCGIDKLEKRGIKYKDVMSNILSTAKGAKAFDFLADVKFDINRLSAENFQRLTNVIDKYGVDKQFRDFFTGSKDVNRMLSVMENSGETLGEYMRFIEKVSNDPKMFAGTITISGKKMKFSEFFNDIDDAYGYYHEVGTKYRYISKFHELSNIGVLILVKDGIEVVGKIIIIKSIDSGIEFIKGYEKN
ncbi:hypothetical protein BZG02_09845 [Labilibaculum filiforme]|uniref:Uncharacterized protein n=1 Tax=Labilibaculum filiforme TaxID=1940526 RepID=A0A2N3HYE4_9BACT|nr:hypothetical protein [Labilibaculum filiforme]PKQ63061.1 hypothetical protein BZG02_09845 [Labilibaculum filiforme]